MEVTEQPTAPYLDAVVAYGFRGPGRFHVPGHKGGAGAGPGLGHRLGGRAVQLTIQHLTNGATQGNHALALALAPLGAPVVVQRNSHASLVDGLVLSGGVPSYVAP